jgi:hypothetical protein
MAMHQNKPSLDADAGAAKAPIWRPLRFALFIILFGVGGVFGWGAFAMIDSAVIAPGTLMVELNRRNVQHLEGGIVGEVLVREGALVAAGQPLIRLDDTRVRAGLNVVLDETARARANCRPDRRTGGSSRTRLPGRTDSTAYGPQGGGNPYRSICGIHRTPECAARADRNPDAACTATAKAD